LYLFIRGVVKQTVVIRESYHFSQISTKFYPHILLPWLPPHAEKIIGDRECGFRRNRSHIDQMFCIRQIPEEKIRTQLSSESAIRVFVIEDIPLNLITYRVNNFFILQLLKQCSKMD